MSIQCELRPDRERGPGHGLLYVTGLGPITGPLELALIRNQGTAPYLGRDGLWQATDAWHPAAEPHAEGRTLVIRVGADVVDPIVALPTNVAFRLTLRANGRQQVGTLKLIRPLLGSGAAAPEPAPAPDALSAGRTLGVEEPTPATPPQSALQDALPEPESSAPEPTPPRRRGLRWVIALVALAILGGAAAFAYLSCLVPGLQPASCGTAAQADRPDLARAEPTAPEPPPARPVSCTGMAAAACLDLAEAAFRGKELERARQLYQQAARLGAVAANVRLGRLYDPDHWSTEASPTGNPDWETAAYWYEEAARQGDPEGLISAGRVLCRHATTPFERRRGLQFLHTAKEKGAGTEVQPLINACGGG
jgi:TPR repeat protein